ncbi:MAG: family 78 glycoside hydrolase catalytic domain [Clostridia bacterium]|nr:family 78 glycoside hydrolase catalytic domain [Clostridia bacterium]
MTMDLEREGFVHLAPVENGENRIGYDIVFGVTETGRYENRTVLTFEDRREGDIREQKTVKRTQKGMCDMEQEKKAAFITLPEYADAVPADVFHRQLEPKEIPAKLPKNLHVLYRARFEALRGEAAVIRITADDGYKLYVNGHFAGQGPAPCFPFKTYVNEIDLGPYLFDGENVLAVHTLYQGLINRVWVSGDDRLGLWFEVRCGERIAAVSDGSVRCRLHSGFEVMGRVGYDTQFMERYDSRAPEVGFEDPDYDDRDWSFAALCCHDDRTLVPQPSAMLTFERIEPVACGRMELPDGRIRLSYDFGAHYVGTLTAEAKGRAGDVISLRFGQELDGEGRVRFVLRSGCRYEEEWILSGRSDRADVPDAFDYKSFRYAELELPGNCEVSGVSILARHYPFALNRLCGTTDPDLVRIWSLCVRSLRYGVQEVIQDCMDREKGQYLGDGSFTSASFAVLTGDLSVMEKLIDNAFDTSFINRGLMTCSPCSMMQEIAEYVLMLPHLLLTHVHLSGSPSFAEAYCERMADVLDFFRERYEKEDGLLYALDKWCVVDWPEAARDGYDFDLREGRINPGTHSVINAYYVGAVKAMNRLAELCGRERYRDPEPLIRAYQENFWDEKRFAVRDIPKKADREGKAHCALPSSAFALCFGLIPDPAGEAQTVERIMEAPADRMAFFGTFAALVGLKRLGREDLIRLILKDEGRWLRMLREGADSTYEAWGRDAKWNTSLFHLCYTYPVLFLCDWGMERIFT